MKKLHYGFTIFFVLFNITAKEAVSSSLSIAKINELKAYFTYQSQNRLVSFFNESEGRFFKSQWDFGDCVISYEKNPVHEFEENGDYLVRLTISDEFGSYTYENSIYVEGNQIVMGKVYMKEFPSEFGSVVMVQKKTSNKDEYTNEKGSNIIEGNFKFSNVKDGDYIFYALPNIDFDGYFFPKYIPTYTGNVIYWQDALDINVKKDIKDLKIQFISFEMPFYGKCRIKGNISNFSPNSNTLLQSIPVILLDENKTPMDFRIPNIETGEFEFKDLPIGKYYLHPEKVNFETQDMEVLLTSENNIAEGISFELLNNKISVEKKKPDPENPDVIMTFPNPIKDELNIDLSTLNVNENDMFYVEIINMSGKKILYNLKTNNDYKLSLNTSNLNAGIYFVKISDSDENLIGFRRIVKVSF